MDFTWNDSKQVVLAKPPAHPKKITGTRFAAILEVNDWTTPFQEWCEITKLYNKPFEDTIFTLAGKAIEPLQAKYVEDAYGIKLTSPSDIYGANYFKTTYGNFFKHPFLGGMWDYLEYDEEGNVKTVYEMKTSKRPQDWLDDIPEYYALQAALYAYLLGCDNVVMCATFLDYPQEYDHPENKKLDIYNTVLKPFKVSERYPNFDEYIAYAENWWTTRVLAGVSPQYDEVKDKEYLDHLRTVKPEVLDTNIDDLIKELVRLKEILAERKPLEDRVSAIEKTLKEYAISNLGSNDKTFVFGDDDSYPVVRKTLRKKEVFNKKLLTNLGLYDKIVTVEETPVYTISYKRGKKKGDN